MRFNGTKGEWCKSNNGVQSICGNMIFESIDGIKTYTERNANIRIASAAPNMLEALQGLIDPITGLVYDGVAQKIGAQESDAIEQAISKALQP